MSERKENPSGDDVTHDETKWMAIVIELFAVVGAIGFAVIQSW